MPRHRNVVIFPLARCTAKVRCVALALDTKPTDARRKAYWAQTLRSIRVALARVGAEESEITAQVEQFGQAVTAELCRRAS
jgi:hypothetical protein